MATHCVPASQQKDKGRVKLSEAEMKKAQADLLEDTMQMVKEKFATLTSKQQAQITKRITEIEIK